MCSCKNKLWQGLVETDLGIMLADWGRRKKCQEEWIDTVEYSFIVDQRCMFKCHS